MRATFEYSIYNIQQDKVIHSKVWRTGRSPGIALLDMTDRTESPLQFIALIAKQYPSRIAVATTKEGNGITFENDAVKLLPYRALNPAVLLVRLRLSNLPFLNEDILKEQLKMSLEPYGSVLDLGSYEDPTQAPIWAKHPLGLVSGVPAPFWLNRKRTAQMMAKEQRDYVKSEIRLFTQHYAIDYTNWYKKSIKVLQRKRNSFLRSQPPIAIRLQCLPVMDQQIESLQQELVNIAALKAGICWREHGEKSAGYLKRIHQQSSPGSDGLGYVFMHLIYQFSPLKDLIIKIYNMTLAADSFPSSWQDLRVRLLLKKGDLSILKNWRPISLINCDAKIYTHIINQRMRSVMDTIINRYQTGFLGDRFIAENGMILNILMEQAHVQKRPEIGLLLAQEKAYDRVHLMYFRQTMLAFGFPPSLVHSLRNLFFGNAVRININGYFTNRVDQRHGLRQGDPLSSLLFNIALEPFLRHTLQDSSFQGFQFQVVSNSDTTTSNIMPPPLKILVYVDDVCVLLYSTDDYCRLHHHLDRYGSVSNAKVNIHKTEAFSLDGRSYPEWIVFLAVQGISKWHDHSSPSPFRYLGFPFIQSFHQRRYLEQQLLQTVKSQCTIYYQCRLSIKGRATIVNALILSKLWCVLRMVHLPTTFFRRLNSEIYQFVWHNCKPKIEYMQLCLDPKLGGLGLLDPQFQRHNLHIRWLRQHLEDNLPQSCSQPILLDHIRRFHSGNTGTRLALFFPLLRLRPTAHANNFMQNIYETVDSFVYADTQQTKCTPDSLLRLPLSAIFAMIPTDYWITRSRHKKLKVSQFFTYDHHFGCIWPLLSSDQPSSPRLVSKLRRDIHNRVIKLNQLIWPHILNQNKPLAPMDQSQT
ncbi:hypothetical protein G6F66_011268 [Rhizopus arrhizus]|nr:hypothetical protein G6F66_011268 [Rhizopus arrhizus]